MPGKKFQFSLQSVLTLREHDAERAHQRLARAIRRRREQEARLEHLRQRVRDMTARAPGEGTVAPMTLRAYEAHRMAAQRACEAARERLETLRAKEAEARATWIAKRQDEEALQTLHDEEKAAFVKEREEAETAFLDEQAVLSFSRKKHLLNL